METSIRMTGRIGLVVALTGLSACSWFDGSRSSHTAPSPSAAATPIAPPTAPVAQVTIRDVQSALQQAGYYKTGKVDGIWGRSTEREVARFQRDHNLVANGKLDVPTLQALNLTGTPPSTADARNPPPRDYVPPAASRPADNASDSSQPTPAR